MSDRLIASVVVPNKAATRLNTTTERDGRPLPGWVVVGMFVPAADGGPTCVDYRVRAVPDTRNAISTGATARAIGSAMSGQHDTLPTPTPAPGGIPRYVFEQASQMQLLRAAREQVEAQDYLQAMRGPDAAPWLSDAARALLAASTHRKGGRPPVRGLLAKLRILVDVEQAYDTGGSLDDVAHTWQMSRSGLRDLLSWARHDVSPRLFTESGHGKRGGALTRDAAALLVELEGK